MLAGIQNRFVLGCAGDDVVALGSIHLIHAFNRKVVGLGSAGSKNDLLRISTNQLCYLLAGIINRFFG